MKMVRRCKDVPVERTNSCFSMSFRGKQVLFVVNEYNPKAVVAVADLSEYITAQVRKLGSSGQSQELNQYGLKNCPLSCSKSGARITF